MTQATVFTPGMRVAIWTYGSWSARVRSAHVTTVHKNGRFQTDDSSDRWWKADNWRPTRAAPSPRKDWVRDRVEPWTEATTLWVKAEQERREHRAKVAHVSAAKVSEGHRTEDVNRLGLCLVAMAFAPVEG